MDRGKTGSHLNENTYLFDPRRGYQRYRYIDIYSDFFFMFVRVNATIDVGFVASFTPLSLTV